MKATPQSQGQQLVVYQKKSSSTAGASQKTHSQEIGSSKFFSTYHVSYVMHTSPNNLMPSRFF